MQSFIISRFFTELKDSKYEYLLNMYSFTQRPMSNNSLVYANDTMQHYF